MGTPAFDVGNRNGNDWMWRAIRTFGLLKAESMLGDKIFELHQCEEGTPEERDAFLHGAQEALRAVKGQKST